MNPYEVVPTDTLLTQGDILEACPIFMLHPSAPIDRLDQELDGQFQRVVVLSQACDLANAKATRVQVASVFRASALVDDGILKAPQIRDQIRRGQIFGWYFLPASADPNLPESVVDLRELHTVPRDFVDRLIAAGNRIGRLITPFREHLAQHFAVTYKRIALPDPYETQP